MPYFTRKKEQVANQHDGSVSWGKVVGAWLINLRLLPQYLTAPLTVITAASTVCTAPFTVITAASTCDTIVDPLPVELFQEDTHANPSPHSDPTLGLYAYWRIGK